MDQGAIRSLKAHYRAQTIRKLIDAKKFIPPCFSLEEQLRKMQRLWMILSTLQALEVEKDEDGDKNIFIETTSQQQGDVRQALEVVQIYMIFSANGGVFTNV